MQILLYLSSVLQQWGSLITGGVIMAAIGIFERATERAISWRLFLWISAFFLFLASYFAWEDQYTGRLKAECKLAKFHTAKDQRRDFIGEKLDGFYVRSQELINRNVTPNSFSLWNDEATSFLQSTKAWIKSNMGDAAATKLDDLEVNVDFTKKISDAHNETMNVLRSQSISLLALHQLQWDRFSPPDSPDCY